MESHTALGVTDSTMTACIIVLIGIRTFALAPSFHQRKRK
jgi:hypothetical protein